MTDWAKEQFETIGGLEEWAEDIHNSMKDADKFYRAHFDDLPPKTAFCLMALIGASLHGLFSASRAEPEKELDRDFFFNFAAVITELVLADEDDGVRH
mgnify:CR=1 FL=1